MRPLVHASLVPITATFALAAAIWALSVHYARHVAFPEKTGRFDYVNLNTPADIRHYEELAKPQSPTGKFTEHLEYEIQKGFHSTPWTEGAIEALKSSLNDVQRKIDYPIMVDSAVCAGDLCQVRLSFVTDNVNRDLEAFQFEMSAAQRDLVWTGAAMGGAVMAFLPVEESGGYRVYIVITAGHG